MNFEYSPRVKELERDLRAFMDEYIYPNEVRYHREIENDRWTPAKIIEELKPKARAAGRRTLERRNRQLEQPLRPIRALTSDPRS